MSMQMKAIAFNIGLGAATSTVTIAGAGFTPQFALFFMSGITGSSDLTARQTHLRGIGMAGGGSMFAASNHSLDNNAAADTDSHVRNDACVLAITVTGAVEGRASLLSFNSDGCTLTIDDAFAADYRIGVLFIGGSDITNVFMAQRDVPAVGTTPFTEDVTAPGFTCSDGQALLIEVSLGTLVSPDQMNGNFVDSRMGIGFATSVAQQGVWGGGSNQASNPTVAKSLARTPTMCALPSSAIAGPNRRISFNGWIANGFQLNHLELNATATKHFYAVIKGGRFSVQGLTTQTDLVTGIAVVESGAGTPVGGLILSRGDVATASDTLAAHDVWSLGAWDSPTSRLAMATFDKDAVTPSYCESGLHQSAVYLRLDGSGAVTGLMDVASVAADTVNFIMDDADPAGEFALAVTGYTALVGGGGGTGAIQQHRQEGY